MTATLSAFVGALVWAAEPQPQKLQEVVYDAASQDIDYRNNTTVLRDVSITQGDLKVRAKEATAEGGTSFADNRWTLRDDVRITTNGGSLRSDRAEVVFLNNRVNSARITGSPASFEQLLENGKDTVRGRAGVIEYDFGAGIVKLTDRVWFSNGKDEFGGEVVIYDVRSEKIRINPDGQSGRVKGIIRPREQPQEQTKQSQPGGESGT